MMGYGKYYGYVSYGYVGYGYGSERNISNYFDISVKKKKLFGGLLKKLKGLVGKK
jgi:hypothetical protein